MALRTSRSDAVGANHEMITLARQARGLTQSELAERIGMSQGHLSKMEAGALPISPDTLTTMSGVLDYPVSFFMQTDRVFGASTSEFFHRKRSSVPARVLDKIHAQLNVRRMHVARLMRSLDVPVSIPRFDPDEFHGDIEEIARAVRAMWQLPRGPVKNLVQVIEDAGGIVIRMRFDTAKVDAVSWWTPGDPPIFALNETMPADRERHTLAHELGHIVMHDAVRPEMEDEAERFAGSFLMPAEDIRTQLRGASLQSLAGLKPYWRVSMQALLKQAQRIGSITPRHAKSLWVQISRAGYRTREPAELDFPKEEISLLSELVDLHVSDLNYDVEQLCALLHVHEHELAASYGVGGARGPALRLIK